MTKLLRAKQQAHETGVFADAGWYRRASYALRMLGQQCQRIQDEQARRRRERGQGPRRVSEQEAFKIALLKLLNEYLTDDQREELIAEATAMQQKILAGEPY